jgi:hypothetical protein
MDRYLTSDLYLAAYLRLKGYTLEFEKSGKKVTFCFPKSDELNNSVIEYLNEKGTCSPLKYSNSIKNLKNLIYNM